MATASTSPKLAAAGTFTPTPTPKFAPYTSRPKPEAVMAIGTGDGALVMTEYHLALLKAMYWLRDQVADRSTVSFYSGKSHRSSTFDSAMADVRKAGLANGWQLTAAGEQLIASQAGDKPRGPELREWLRPHLDEYCNKLLDAHLQVYPRRLLRDELGEAAGVSTRSSTFDSSVATLRKVKAIEGDQKAGGTKAADTFV